MKTLFLSLVLCVSAQAQILRQIMVKPPAAGAATITWDTNLATTNCSGTKTNASPCVTASKTQTSGELLLMYCFLELASPATITPSNSKGDTWHQIASGPVQGTFGYPTTANVWWAIAGSSGAGTYTCTPSATGYMDAMAGGWTSSTGWNATPVDTIHFAGSTVNTTCAVTSDGNVTAAAELAVAICNDLDSGITAAGAPWNTARQQFDGNVVIMQDRLGSLTAGATISYSATMSGTSSGNELNAIVVLKPI